MQKTTNIPITFWQLLKFNHVSKHHPSAKWILCTDTHNVAAHQELSSSSLLTSSPDLTNNLSCSQELTSFTLSYSLQTRYLSASSPLTDGWPSHSSAVQTGPSLGMVPSSSPSFLPLPPAFLLLWVASSSSCTLRPVSVLHPVIPVARPCLLPPCWLRKSCTNAARFSVGLLSLPPVSTFLCSAHAFPPAHMSEMLWKAKQQKE